MRYITLAIHTKARAESLLEILKSNRIDAIVVPYDSSEEELSHLYMVQVNTVYLSRAVKVFESYGADTLGEVMHDGKSKSRILIPVDFSKMSMIACRAGFELAERLNLTPLLLHAYALGHIPEEPDCESMPDMFGGINDGVKQIQQIRDDKRLRAEADRMMRKLADEVRSAQRQGLLPQLKFAYTVSPGLPEEVIAEYVKSEHPPLVVMATRGRDKRELELIGSVTAEVLDDCRAPIFTVPENYTFCGVRNITKLVMFCNLDRQDILSFDALMRMFGFPEIEVWLVPIAEKFAQPSKVVEKTESLCDYLTGNYPTVTFHTAYLAAKDFHAQFSTFALETGMQMIIVPNKRKNIFSRLFNPGIAHRFLFERDIPMLAIPV